MHDAKGRELQVGDRVLIPAIVEYVNAIEDYCNVGVVTELGRRPDGQPERIGAINTAVMFRDRAGDDNGGLLKGQPPIAEAPPVSQQ